MTSEKKETAIKPKKFLSNALIRNLVILATVAGILVALYVTSERFSLHVQFIVKALSQGNLQQIKDYIQAWGLWAPLVSAFIMIFQSIAAPLPAFLVTVTNGWLFGTWWGTALSWSSSMAGAALCFYIARGFGRPAAERFVSKKALGFVDNFFRRYGNNSVLIARLLPIVSFDAVSYAAGLTSISFRGFFIATGIGQLPATIIYSWLGEQLTITAKIGLYAFLGVAALLVLGLTVKQAIQKRLKPAEPGLAIKP